MLLSPFHHFFIQSEAYFERFAESGLDKAKMTIAGNVKLDSEAPVVDEAAKERALRVTPFRFRKTNCDDWQHTCREEEELCVEVFNKLSKDFSNLQFVLVPRHPERFDGVAEMLKSEGMSYLRATEKTENSKSENFVLVDKMGVLMKLYAISDIAVVAGSFTPHVGGHNIFEPSFYGKPFCLWPVDLQTTGLSSDEFRVQCRCSV